MIQQEKELHSSLLALSLWLLLALIWSLPCQATAHVLSGAADERGSLCSDFLQRGRIFPAPDVRGVEDVPGLEVLEETLHRLQVEVASPRYDDLRTAAERAIGSGPGKVPGELPREVNTVAFHPHELRAARAYALLARKSRGETVVLIPSLSGREVYAFDGIIRNAENATVARLSLKTCFGRNPLKLAYQAIDKGVKYNTLQEWVPEFINAKAHEKDRFKDWLLGVIRMFEIEAQPLAPRTRVVVELTGTQPLPAFYSEEVASLRRRLALHSAIVESVTFLKDDFYLVVEP